METNTKPRYICRFKGKNDCISYEWKEVNMETNMKIDVEESIVYRFDSKEDLSQCVLLLGGKGYFSNYKDFSTYEYGELSEIRCWMQLCNHPFVRLENGERTEYKYFIDEESVVFEEENNLRPYKDISEFCVETGCEVLGEDFITIKNKNTQKEYTLLYVGYSNEEVQLGGYILTFANLLKNYEYALNNFEWLPFGIEE